MRSPCIRRPINPDDTLQTLIWHDFMIIQSSWLQISSCMLMTPRLRTPSKTVQVPGSRDGICTAGSSNELTRLIPRRLRAKSYESLPNRATLDNNGGPATGSLHRTRSSRGRRVPSSSRRLYMIAHTDGGRRELTSYARMRSRSAFASRDIHDSSHSSAELVSPMPTMTFSVIGGASNNAFTTRKVLEELVQSEEAYISSLNTLRVYYIEPYTLRLAQGLAAPIEMADHYLGCMIEKHTRLSRRLQELSGLCYGLDAFAIAAAQELAANAIDVELYQSYCNIYEDVLKVVKPLMTSKSDEIDFSVQWMKGWETFLESTQPASRHADLSFFSLIQRPVQRIAKYRLILEALFKCLNAESRGRLSENLQIIKDQLVAVNRGVENSEHKRLSSHINSYVNFEGISYAFRVSLEFFGFAQLVGGLYVMWLQDGVIELEQCAAFLYHSHFVLTQSRKDRKSGKRLPRFILPLLRCRLILDSKDHHEGIVTPYPLTHKLLFEKDGYQHELMILFTSKQEQDIWSDKLQPLTLYSKRGSAMNFSQPQLRSLQVFPDQWNRYSVILRQNMWPFSKACYSSEPRLVQIITNYSISPCSLEISSPLEIFEYPVSVCLSTREEATFYIKRGERAFLEDDLGCMWSEALPMVTWTKHGATTNLRKSLSWSNMRRLTRRKLRHTQSFHGIVQAQRKSQPESGTSAAGNALPKSEFRRNNSISTKLRHAVRDFFTPNVME